MRISILLIAALAVMDASLALAQPVTPTQTQPQSAAPAVNAGYPCPAGLASCKVVVLSPDEFQALLGRNMILDTAEQGRPLDLGLAVKFFRDKISNAPAGVPTAVTTNPPAK